MKTYIITVKDRKDKFLSEEAKKLKQELGLYKQHYQSSNNANCKSIRAGHAKEQSQLPQWRAELTERMNDALQMIIDDNNTTNAIKLIESQLSQFDELRNIVNDDKEKQILNEVIRKAKRLIELFKNYKIKGEN